MPWVAIPTKLDGDGYTELMDHENGAAHYGAWVTMVSIAAKCAIRGTLVRDSRTDSAPRPHDAGSLSRISRIPAAVFEEAIPRLIAIRWLETVDESGKQLTTIPHEGAAQVRDECGETAESVRLACARDETLRNGTGRNETLRDEDGTGRNVPAAPASVPDCQAVVNHYQTYHPRAKPSEKERKLIRARLKDGYSVADLCDAIDGNHLSKWHCGENDERREYHALDLIMRDGGKVASFIAFKEQPRAPDKRTSRAAAAINEVLSMIPGGDDEPI